MYGPLSDAKVQLRNAESSVLFLQQEHAKTLEGLYSEISKLQKKCGELTFQMAMNSTCIAPDQENFQEKCLNAEKELDKRNSEVLELKKLLENKAKHNSLLEKSLRTAEENYEETVRTKDKKIASLTAELDAKAGNIAYLTKQLHDSKVALAELGEKLCSINMGATERNIISPAPPDRAPMGSRRRFVRKTSASNDTNDVETLRNGLNPTSQKMFLNVKTTKSSDGFPSRSTRSRTPTQRNTRNTRSLGDPSVLMNQSRTVPDDYTEFLKTGSKPETKLVYKPVPNPLPPILNDINSCATPAAYKVRRSRGQEAGIVDEILVSPLNSPDKTWRQGSNQYDSVS